MRPGLILGNRYRIEAPLGSGGMGEVWRAYDLKLCVEVALKSLRAEIFSDAEREEILRGEVRTAREVLSPNVCRIFDLIEADGQELLSMEYVDGATLSQTLRHQSPLGLREATAIAAQLLAGLEAIHGAKLVHRDIKPENVMTTRSGRVVIMDLGIARSLSAPRTGTISGTPGYMAPEQARGEVVDARADVFSVGVVLAQLIDRRAVTDRESLAEFLRAIRENPPRLPESPWTAVLARALAADREDRYQSAQALARALEEATQRAAGPAERSPYPGLSSFAEADAERFFGREVEVEAMWRKLQRLHLLAIVGPSGTGKSSFLQAGLIPARPEGWACLRCTPGVSPFASLGEALAPELARDGEPPRDLLRLQDSEVATGLFAQWRGRHSQVLLVIDQFEELFTLTSPETQRHFADLLGRLSLDADVHVLLSMRDDFLLRCQEYSVLSPIFSELMPLGPLRGTDLRRAITLPALSSGYRFEDTTLVEEMVSEIAEERGALPLLAFAAAQLWELRDRERRLLTRDAYGRIGGVAGALAKHADATYERILPGRQPMVREIFRNLVTAEGTRVARDREDVQSIFEDRDAAAQVLDELVAARLLTSFEYATAEEASPRRRIEIIHESLLTAWPRLLRWRTQDAEGAQLRDQLRQSAQLWRERGRPEDLLWAGTVYQEFSLWREHYPGRLTETEEEFSGAMSHRARRRRRQRRVVVASAFGVLLSVLGVVGTLWQQSERAQRRAVAEARRAEASKLFTLAKTTQKPSDALAYAIASLELADESVVRREAIKLLHKGPTTFQFSHVEGAHNPWTVEFSPDGRWLAVGWSANGRVQLHPLSGGLPVDLAEDRKIGLFRRRWWVMSTSFSADSRYLAAGSDSVLRLFSVNPPRLMREIPYRGVAWPHFSKTLGGFLIREMPVGEQPRWQLLSPEGNVVRELGRLGPVVGSYVYPAPAVDPQGSRIATWSGSQVVLHDIVNGAFGPPQPIGAHRHPVMLAFFNQQGNMLGTADVSGEVRVWSVEAKTQQPLFILQGGPGSTGGSFDRSGTRVAIGFMDGLRVWNLAEPAWMGPTMLEPGNWVFNPAFHPSDRWLVASASDEKVLGWPMARSQRRGVERGQPVYAAAFSPDGRWLATGSKGTLSLRPLDAVGSGQTRDLLQWPANFFFDVKFDVSGKTVFGVGGSLARGTGTRAGPRQGGLAAVSLETGEVRRWREGQGTISVDPKGRLVTVTTEGHGELVVDPASGRTWTLPNGAGIGFAGDGRFIFETSKGLHVWDPTTDSTRTLELEQDWITSHKPGEFVWRDKRERFWLGDPTGGQPKALGIPKDGRQITDIYPGTDGVVVAYGDGSVELYDNDGGPPHLLLADGAAGAAIDPRGRWVASWGDSGAWLWPMPQGRPLQTLSRDELLAKLRSMTNVRAVPDSTDLSGYSIKADPFPGWEAVTTW